MQGCARCELFKFFACGRARLGEESAERNQVVCGFFMSWLKPRPTKNFERNVKSRTFKIRRVRRPQKISVYFSPAGGFGHPPVGMTNHVESCAQNGPTDGTILRQSELHPISNLDVLGCPSC
jgi:hypothetical protein